MYQTARVNQVSQQLCRTSELTRKTPGLIHARNQLITTKLYIYTKSPLQVVPVIRIAPAGRSLKSLLQFETEEQVYQV